MLKMLTLILCLVLVLSVGGAYAMWVYHRPTTPMTEGISPILGIFDYKPEEVLPGEGGNGGVVTPGENHLGLVELILNEDSNFGFNLGSKSVIYKNLQSKRVVFCNQSASGKNLKHLLNHEDNTYGLYYCVEKVTNTFLYVYTFSLTDLPDMGGQLGSEIIVYRTALEKTDKWRATVSHVGNAEMKKLSEMGASVLNESNTSDYSIDITTWHNEHIE